MLEDEKKYGNTENNTIDIIGCRPHGTIHLALLSWASWYLFVPCIENPSPQRGVREMPLAKYGTPFSRQDGIRQKAVGQAFQL